MICCFGISIMETITTGYATLATFQLLDVHWTQCFYNIQCFQDFLVPCPISIEFYSPVESTLENCNKIFIHLSINNMIHYNKLFFSSMVHLRMSTCHFPTWMCPSNWVGRNSGFCPLNARKCPHYGAHCCKLRSMSPTYSNHQATRCNLDMFSIYTYLWSTLLFPYIFLVRCPILVKINGAIKSSFENLW